MALCRERLRGTASLVHSADAAGDGARRSAALSGSDWHKGNGESWAIPACDTTQTIAGPALPCGFDAGGSRGDVPFTALGRANQAS